MGKIEKALWESAASFNSYYGLMTGHGMTDMSSVHIHKPWFKPLNIMMSGTFIC